LAFNSLVKVALVILHADPARGGAERYTVDLATGLRSRGHEVALIATTFAPDIQTPSDVHLDVGATTRLGRYLRFLDRLDAHLAASHYDIVHAMLPVRHCDVYHPHAGIAAETLTRGHLKYDGTLKRAAARVANFMNAKRRRFAAVEHRLMMSPSSPVVLCLSEYVKRDLLAHYAIDPARLATLFNAVDLAWFDPDKRPEAGKEVRQRLGLSDDAVVALMIAQDFQRKGLREAILAISRTALPRLVLLVVGKEDPAPYRRLAREQNVHDRVIFAGKTDDPYAFYKSADFFVLPTRHDPCSLVVLEALAMGLPVISTVFNGACEIMTTGEHGYVLPDPADVDALSQSMQALLVPGARDAMSRACLALRSRLAYGHHLDQLMGIYQRARK
jgi:UDP-glucose:(heptosyl)LPS alpha-1,3-glucosyltransferase